MRVKGVNSRAFSGVCSLYRAISKFYLQKYLVDVQLFVQQCTTVLHPFRASI